MGDTTPRERAAEASRIPDFRLATDEQLMERGGQLMLQTVPLEWEA